jgi:hypothetical protein
MYSGTPGNHDSLIVSIPWSIAGITSPWGDLHGHSPPTFFGIGDSGITGIRGQAPMYVNTDGSITGLDINGNTVLWGNMSLSGNLNIPQNDYIRWLTNGYLTSTAANEMQVGPKASASPSTQTLNGQGSRGGTDINVAGGDFILVPGLGTGNAAGACLHLQGAHATTSGSTQQTGVDGVKICDDAVVIEQPITSGSTPAVTCPTGAPSSSFAVVNGIVTHC